MPRSNTVAERFSDAECKKICDLYRAGGVTMLELGRRFGSSKVAVFHVLAKGGLADDSRSGSRLYSIWQNMKKRCVTKHPHIYPHYRARGITVCAKWRDSFAAFKGWAEAHGYRDDLTIDRIDNDRGYEPGNCRWATWSEQNTNKRPARPERIAA